MNKTELVTAVAQMVAKNASSQGEKVSKAGVGRVLDAFMETVIAQLRRGDQIVLPGFGSFSTGNRSARTGRNPQTGATIQIKASRVAKFRAGKKLKEAVQRG